MNCRRSTRALWTGTAGRRGLPAVPQCLIPVYRKVPSLFPIWSAPGFSSESQIWPWARRSPGHQPNSGVAKIGANAYLVQVRWEADIQRPGQGPAHSGTRGERGRWPVTNRREQLPSSAGRSAQVRIARVRVMIRRRASSAEGALAPARTTTAFQSASVVLPGPRGRRSGRQTQRPLHTSSADGLQSSGALSASAAEVVRGCSPSAAWPSRSSATFPSTNTNKENVS
jgi:hypothetical protein